MREARDAGFGFSIAKTSTGWRWAAFDAQGRALEAGAAPNRAVAAACVIRVIARNYAPEMQKPVPHRAAS